MRKIIPLLALILAIGLFSCNPSGMSANEVEKSNSIQQDTIIYDGVYPPHDDGVMN